MNTSKCHVLDTQIKKSSIQIIKRTEPTEQTFGFKNDFLFKFFIYVNGK